jgi:hypothetical protein
MYHGTFSCDVEHNLSSMPAQALAFVITYHDFKDADMHTQFTAEYLQEACQGSRSLSAIHDLSVANLKLAFASNVFRNVAKRFGLSFPDDQTGIDKYDNSSTRSRTKKMVYSIFPYVCS